MVRTKNKVKLFEILPENLFLVDLMLMLKLKLKWSYVKVVAELAPRYCRFVDNHGKKRFNVIFGEED